MKLYAKILGESHAQAILFIPGFVGSHQVWDEQFHSLGQTYKLVLLDTLGFGHSPKPNIAYTMEDHLHALRDTLHALEIQQTRIVGYSMGCLLGLAYAYQFPEEVSRLALLALPWFAHETEAREAIKKSSPFNRWLAMDTWLAHAACTLMCHLRPWLMPLMPVLVRDVPAAVAKDALRHNWQSYSQTLTHVIFEADTTKWMQGIEKPILLIHGRNDQTAPLANVKRYSASLPNLQLIELAADHGLVFSHSAAIAAALKTFFASTTSTRV